MFETLGQYKILERIGAGGMGDVYRARDTRLGRTVAIKVLSATVADDPDRRERFMREARAAAALSHPNIAALYEVGDDQGVLFLAFEFVPGETLRTVIGGRPLNARRAIDLAIQIADALADAHAEGIVHRDIKADNIIVTPKGNAKILDFGLATWTAGGAEREHAADQPTATTTGVGTTLGTVAYMSPEQALGERVDHRTDIFSLGIVLFEMLTGKLPFNGATPTALSLQIVQAPAPRPSAINRDLPAELDEVVLKTLAKSFDQRYESAATLAAELRTVAAILDVRAARVEPPEVAGVAKRATSGTTVRRASWRPALAGLVIVVALAAAAWSERASLTRIFRHTLGPPPAPILAVVPFDTDPDQVFFADGLAEDLITRLGQTPGLKVIGRSATRTYRGRAPRDVARELGAAVVLTGSVRPAGDVVKISLELIDPADGADVWTSQFTRDVKDIFAVQADVAEQVAGALRVTLRPTASSARAASRTVDPRAYQLYARGRQATAERRTDEAIALYEQAIAADPGLAEAFAGIAEALEYATMVFGERLDGERQRRLTSAAERAYQLDPDLPQANLAMALAAASLHSTLGYLRRAVDLDQSYGEGFHQIGDQIMDFDPSTAIDFYRASLAVDPGLQVGHMDIALALIALDRAADGHQAVDRLSGAFVIWRDAFHALLDLDEGRPDVALKRLAATSAPQPFDRILRKRALATAGRIREALAIPGRVTAESPCADRTITAAVRRETGDAAGARDLVAVTLERARAAEPSEADAVRCGVFAAAAMNDPATAGALLERVADREEWLRYWALPILTDAGSVMLRGRTYPWNRIADAPPIVAARERLDAAYAREREIAKTALAGLLK
jgi:TolB-like protein/predicted Ser/Thr protein kinase